MEMRETDIEITVEYDVDNEEHVQAVSKFWAEIDANLKELNKKYGIGIKHGEVII